MLVWRILKMTISWKEVSPYSGQPVEEDAPTNFAGQGSGVAMPPDAMMKKKKRLLDARTKAYRQHRENLIVQEQEEKKENLNSHKRFKKTSWTSIVRFILKRTT